MKVSVLSKKAISQALSVAIVIVIIVVAFGGYEVGTLERSTTINNGYPPIPTLTSTVTIPTTITSTTSVTVTPYCCTDSNLSLSTTCSTILTPNYSPVQILQYLVETDPAFIAAEHGLDYTTQLAGCGGGFSVGGGPNGTFVYFQSTYTNNSVYTDNCGNVGKFTYYLNVAVPLTETGYNMSAILITPRNSSEITVTCSTTT